MNLVRLLLLLALLPLDAAFARELFVCTGRDGVRAYQDAPCAESSAGIVRVLPDQPLDDPRLQSERLARSRAQQARELDAQQSRLERAARGALPASLGGSEPRASRAAPARRAAQRTPSACDAARERRERAYRRDGNRMDFARRRELQDALDEACGLR